MKERERLRSVELDPAVVHAFAQTFISRWDCYPLQLEDGTYTQIQEPLTYGHLFKHLTYGHLEGYAPFTIGAYALDEKSQAKWVCFDADEPEQWDDLWRLAERLTEVSISAYLEPSRRGGHLWLFTPLLSGAEMRQFAQKLLVMENIPLYSKERKRRLEIYPKQNALGAGAGSFVRLPFGVHQKTGQIYHFLDVDGNPIAPSIREQLQLLGQPDKVSQAFLDAILAQDIVIPPPPPKPTPKFKKRKRRRREPLSETLKQAISVFDFVSRYVVLNEQGKGLCPFHDDIQSSFGVNKERNYWHCFAGCGGGSIIDFWMKWRAVLGQDASFVETVKELRTLIFD